MAGPPQTIKIKRPKGLDPALERSRARGALLGLAVGDALGATHELRKLPAPPFPTLMDGTQTEMKGAGRFNLQPGQVTDDTQMACCIAQVLKTLHRYDAAEVAKAYVAWKAIAFDVGPQTAQALEAIAARVSLESAARDVWLKSGRKAADNGSLMRTAPVGVFFAKDPAARIRASLEDCALTHFDPRCQLSCVALNASIAKAITSLQPAKPDELAAAASTDVSLAGATLGKTARDFVLEIKDATQWLREDLAAAKLDDPRLYGPELHLHTYPSEVRVAFRLAFWELFHAPTFEAALIDVVNRGGDSDTNAAITGALLGAVHGEEAVPQRWKRPVLEALTRSRGPLIETYHPAQLLTLA